MAVENTELNNNNLQFKSLADECQKIADALRDKTSLTSDDKMIPKDFANYINQIGRSVEINGGNGIAEFHNDTAGLYVDKIAATYYYARACDGKEFKYSADRGPLSPLLISASGNTYRSYVKTKCKETGDISDDDNDTIDAFLIDCSTLVGLVLRGIEFNNSVSPYYNDGNNYSIHNPYSNTNELTSGWNPSNLGVNIDSGIGNILDKQPKNSFSYFGKGQYSQVRTAAALAYFLINNGSYIVFDSNKDGKSGPNTHIKTEPGDIIFWSKPTASINQKLRYRGISHVALVSNDIRKLYEATGFEDYRIKGKTIFLSKWNDAATKLYPTLKDENNIILYEKNFYNLFKNNLIKYNALSQSNKTFLETLKDSNKIVRASSTNMVSLYNTYYDANVEYDENDYTAKYKDISLILRPRYKIPANKRYINLLYNPYIKSTTKYYPPKIENDDDASQEDGAIISGDESETAQIEKIDLEKFKIHLGNIEEYNNYNLYTITLRRNICLNPGRYALNFGLELPGIDQDDELTLLIMDMLSENNKSVINVEIKEVEENNQDWSAEGAQLYEVYTDSGGGISGNISFTLSERKKVNIMIKISKQAIEYLMGRGYSSLTIEPQLYKFE